MLIKHWQITAERANHAARVLGAYLHEIAHYVRDNAENTEDHERYEDFAEHGNLLRQQFMDAFAVMGIEFPGDYPLQIVSACYSLSYVTDPAANLEAYKELVDLTGPIRISSYISDMQQLALNQANAKIGEIVRQN